MMFRYIYLLIVCVTLSNTSKNIDYYEQSILEIMNQDVEIVNRNERSIYQNNDQMTFQNSGSGDDGDGGGGSNPGNLTPGYLTPTEIFAIVICSVVAVAVLAFFVSCTWYKMKSRRGHHNFVHVHDDDEDPMIDMAEYEDGNKVYGTQINIQVSHYDHPTLPVENSQDD